MRKRMWVAFGGVVTAGTAAMAMAAASPATAQDSSGAQVDAGEALFAQRCNACHELTTATVKHASAKEWHEIVDRMIMNGAQVTPPEADAIVSYLAKTHGVASDAPANASPQS